MNLKDIAKLDKDDILEMLGVHTGTSVSSVLSVVGILAIGGVAGATAALLVTPKNGRAMRRTLGRHVKKAADDVITPAHSAEAQVVGG